MEEVDHPSILRVFQELWLVFYEVHPILGQSSPVVYSSIKHVLLLRINKKIIFTKNGTVRYNGGNKY